MPRYFFNVSDSTTRDSEGTELESITEAKCEAVKMAGNIICEAAIDFWDTQEWSMTVSNSAGLVLFSLMFIGNEAPAGAKPI